MKKRLKHILFLLTAMQSFNVAAENIAPSVELLAWQASQETASFWASIVTEPSTNKIIYTPPNNTFNWEPGVRVGLSYNSEPSSLEPSIYWTYFASKKDNQVQVGEQIIAPEFFSGFLSKDIFFGANVNWQLILNTLDFKISHPFSIGQSFTLRPSIGIKGGTVFQTINATWDAVLYESAEKLTHKFYGVGPSFGLETKWNLFSQLSIVGDFSTAFMWGNWKIEDSYSRPSALFGLITPTTITTSMDDSMLGTIMFDYFFGLKWHYQAKYDMTFQVGYEMQFWANQLRLPTFQILPLHGDLTLQGGTCRIQIDL